MKKSYYRGIIIFGLYFLIIMGITLTVNIYIDSDIPLFIEIFLCFVMIVSYCFTEELVCKDIKYEKGYLWSYTIGFFIAAVVVIGAIFADSYLFGTRIIKDYESLRLHTSFLAGIEVIIALYIFIASLIVTLIIGCIVNFVKSRKKL